jgi:signal transduction histidine kinase
VIGVAWYRRAARSHPYLADGALAAALYLVTLLSRVAGQPRRGAGDTTVTLILGAVVCGALVLRRRWPIPVLAVVTGAVLAAMVAGSARGPFLAGAVVAAYTVAAYTDRLTAFTAGGLAALLLAGGAMLGSSLPWLAPEHIIIAVWTALATAIGDAVRNRRAYIAAIEERAVRAEQSREQEARRRVAEERLRISRELHDVVAHHIALINVQSGVAAHLLETQPEAAREALAHARKASRTVLDELGMMLGVLRESGDHTGHPDGRDDAPPEPAPGLDRLATLIDSFGAAGLPVRVRISGSPRPLPPLVDLTAYRVVQESLTNVHKHAGGAPALVRLEYAADALLIEVRDEGGDAPPPADDGTGTGHGILGMRERAATVGGKLTAEPDGTGFVVHARLPTPEGDG